MSFIEKKPVYGDHIRVNRGLYSHHGIYIDDDHVCQFASTANGHETDPNYASVCLTTLDDFLKGGVLEVREYTDLELKEKREPQEIVNAALSRLGEKGYDLINNNCEHFANECVFGYKKSEQIDNVMSVLSSIFGGK